LPQSIPAGFIIYHEEAYRLGTIHARGTLSCLTMDAEAYTQVGSSLVSNIELNKFQRTPVQDESERLRRTSPLSIVRILTERANDAGLHLFCALSFEAAHIFDDLDLPADHFAEFIIAEASKCSTSEFITHIQAAQASSQSKAKTKFKLTNDTSPSFEKIFDAAQQHFKVGDIFEVVLSRRFEFLAEDDTAFDYLSESVVTLQAPYRFALPFLRTQLVGASPELLVHVSDRTVTNRPISGSMRRTGTTKALNPEEEATLAGLYASEKEKSELDMLVDLARHDLHRVCDDVEVSAYRESLVLETVVHTQSTVRGRLKTGFDALDAVFSCLNAGTLVGAPKKKAMEIIANLEGSPRRFYGGNLIHVIPGKQPEVRSTILIRTFQISNRRVTLQAGATLLYESRQDFEYWECGSKAKALLDIVGHGSIAHGPGTPPPIDESSKAEPGKFQYLSSFSDIAAVAEMTPAPSAAKLRLLLIDNHDSFTFNLAALFQHLGCEVTVVRNDRELPPSDSFDALLLSPGPSAPRDAGNLIAIAKAFWLHKPIFGVCLGFQAMIEARGGELGILPEPLHGKVRSVQQCNKSIFLKNLPEKFSVARYHSLYGKTMPPDLRIIATDARGVPMAFDSLVSNRESAAAVGESDPPPHCAVQFHPESFMTGTNGVLIARNWTNAVFEYVARTRTLQQGNSTDQSLAQSLVRQILEEEPNLAFLEASLDRALRLGGRVLAETVQILRRHATVSSDLDCVASSIKASGAEIFEVCGTGGTKSLRLNTSTLTALYAAAADLCIVKHGGRSASGHKGSVDLLEHLGLEPERLFECAGESLRTLGISFLGAAFTYAPFARYAQMRKAYGKPTIFNLLGPLLNPARPSFRLIGCFDEEYLSVLADALVALGEDGAIAVGRDQYGPIDEIHPRGNTLVALVQDGHALYGELPPLTSNNPAHNLNRLECFADGLKAAQIILNSETHPPADTFDKNVLQYGLEFIMANLAFLLFAQERKRGENTLNVARIRKHFATLMADSSRLSVTANAIRNALSKLSDNNPRSPLAEFKPFLSQRKQTEQEEQASAESVTLPTAQNTAVNMPSLSERAERLWKSPGPMVIAEIKLKTPLVNFEAIDVSTQVQEYTAAGACAISVVTHPLFDGSIALLQRVRSLTELPIIAKDFINTLEQADQLVLAGADGFLLLEDWLGVELTTELGCYLRSKGLLPVVESTLRVPPMHEYPFEFMPLLNTRNLFTLSLGSRFRQALAQTSPQAVCASDIKTATDGFFGCIQNRGILVGEALMRRQAGSPADSIGTFVSHCKKRFLFKACGARSPEHVTAALEAGADLVGINLLPHSRRYCTPEKLQTIVKFVLGAPSLAERLVILTGLDTPAESAKILCSLGNDILMRLREQPYDNLLLRRLVKPESAQAIRVLSPYFSNRKNSAVVYGAQAAIVDGSVPGSGIAESIPPCPDLLGHLPVLLAGGVQSSNLETRLDEATKQGWTIAGIDVASGVSAPDGYGFSAGRINELARALQLYRFDDAIH
jgi:anthranilate phosphoribosyltransferase